MPRSCTVRRFTGRVAGALAVVLLSAGCGGSAVAPSTPAAPPRGLAQIVEQGTIRVCSTGDYQPFTYRNPRGEWSGMDIDLANDMARRLNVKLDLLPTTWGTMMTDLGGACDVAMGGISITLDRAQRALYSAAYLRDGKAAIVRCADGPKYPTLDAIDQPGVRVVVNPGGTNAQFDKAHLRRANVVTYPDNNTIFGQLIDDRADVMITDASEIRFQTAKHSQLCAVAVDHPFTFEQKAYLVPQNDPPLQQWLDQWLTIVDGDGTYAALSTKWLGQVVGP
jgi:cyclohexadienyl dehydratase